VRPNPKQHIYVKLFPNRAFKVGEHVDLTVEAFDAGTGQVLRDLPVVIGNIRGTTGRPIPLTIGLSTSQHCYSVQGQTFCLNAVIPPSGYVVTPNGSYPGGGNNFTLSAVMPKLIVTVAGGNAVQPGAALTVSAVDARTRQPVAGAKVLRADVLSNTRIAPQQPVATSTPVGDANRPIVNVVREVGPIQVKRRIGTEIRTETLPASYGPPLIVSAPGYSDELVRYVFGNPGSPVKR
jgi:hypothetical protein